MRPEPAIKRVAAFVDGQNLFHGAREAFGHTVPSYEPHTLADAICNARGWSLRATHFYTGIPGAAESPRWHRFWVAKLARMGTRGIRTFARPIRYREQGHRLPDGSVVRIRVGQEKGIDVRIALDVVRLARDDAYDVALLLTQDQDLSEVADEVRAISRADHRWIKVASAFPLSTASRNRRGVNRTDWIPISRELYDRSLDPADPWSGP